MRQGRRARRVWAVLFALVAAGTARAGDSGGLRRGLRGHLRGESFVAVPGVAALPAGVRDALQALWHSPRFEVAEPGAEFQVTDVILKPNLPIRRLVLAGCSADHCLIYYERGGIAHTHLVVLLRTKDAVRFDWGGVAPPDLADLVQLKDAVISGKVRGDTGPW